MSPSNRSHRTLATAVLAVVLSGCSVWQGERPIRHLDRNTGITYRWVSQPLVLAHFQPQTAVHARDYATVVTGWVDRDGDAGYVLILYFWSTIDPRDTPRPTLRPATIVLTADDRRIVLSAGQSPAPDAADVPRRDRPPVAAHVVVEYPVTASALRSLAAADQIALREVDGQRGRRYALWNGGQKALMGLIRKEN